MLSIHTQRTVRLATITRGTAIVVVAFLVEVRGGEEHIISGPRIVKIIQKKNTELASGRPGQSILALPAPASWPLVHHVCVVSPFVATIFGFTTSRSIIGLAAQPPTFK